MLQVCPVVTVEAMEDVPENGQTPTWSARPQKSRESAHRIRGVFDRPVQRALHEGWAWQARLDQGPVYQPLSGARDQAVGSVAVERRQAGVALKQGAYEIHEQRRYSSGSRGAEQAGETRFSTLTPTAEDAVDHQRHAGRHELVGRRERRPIDLGGVSGCPVPSLRFRSIELHATPFGETFHGLARGSRAGARALQCVTEVEPDALPRGHGG